MDIKQNSKSLGHFSSPDNTTFTGLQMFAKTAKSVTDFSGSFCRIDTIRLRHITQREQQNDRRGNNRCNLYATAGYNRRNQDRRSAP